MGANDYNNLRNLWDTRWTPVTDEVKALFRVAVREAESLTALGSFVDIKPRHIRRVINGPAKSVSFRVADQVLSRSSVGHRVSELPWHTPQEMVELGYWKRQWGNAAVPSTGP